MIEEAIATLGSQLGGREWVAGDTFGVTDVALFYVERWPLQAAVDWPANVAAHFEQ